MESIWNKSKSRCEVHAFIYHMLVSASSVIRRVPGLALGKKEAPGTCSLPSRGLHSTKGRPISKRFP